MVGGCTNGIVLGASALQGFEYPTDTQNDPENIVFLPSEHRGHTNIGGDGNGILISTISE